MATYKKALTKSELGKGKMKEVRLDGKPIVIAESDGEYFAFDATCTHAQCALAGGFLDGYTLTCYCHGAQFDISTGEVLAPPAPSPIHIYKVKEENGDLMVEV